MIDLWLKWCYDTNVWDWRLWHMSCGYNKGIFQWFMICTLVFLWVVTYICESIFVQLRIYYEICFSIYSNLYMGVAHDKQIYAHVFLIKVAYILSYIWPGFVVLLDDDSWWVLLYFLMSFNDALIWMVYIYSDLVMNWFNLAVVVDSIFSNLMFQWFNWFTML